MSGLTMSQIIKRKAVLEREIFLALETFEQDTGTHIEGVSVERLSYEIDRERPKISNVTATVRL